MKKLNKNGFTFVEMFAALLLLGFMVMVVGTGTYAGLRVYKDSVTYSESNTLCSTLIFSMENELRYATAFDETDGIIDSFTSVNYGTGASFKVDDGKLKISTSANTLALVGDKVYTNGLAVDKLQLKKGDKVSAGQMIDITLTLKNGTTVSTEVLNLNS